MISMAFDEIAEFESEPWKKEMDRNGEAMKSGNVRKVLFVHGTFAGNDPFGFYGVMKQLGVSSGVTEILEIMSEKLKDITLDDLGNFPDGYIDSFHEGIHHNIECVSSGWSSENNHIGRLLAVPELAADIARGAEDLSSDNRVLLIGHSHAGQLFALLTNFLENGHHANTLLNVLAEVEIDGFDLAVFVNNLEIISGIQLDIVTLGTPVRYPWGNYKNYRLLNIVNHRSDSRIDGVLNTRDGDYVQQWGTDGTDLPPANPALKEINDALDKILDQGRPLNIDAKLKEIKRRMPFKENGKEAGDTILVDYRDKGARIFQFMGFRFGSANFIETAFGHGVYTRRKCMLFNSSLIVEQFYTG